MTRSTCGNRQSRPTSSERFELRPLSRMSLGIDPSRLSPETTNLLEELTRHGPVLNLVNALTDARSGVYYNPHTDELEWWLFDSRNGTAICAGAMRRIALSDDHWSAAYIYMKSQVLRDLVHRDEFPCVKGAIFDTDPRTPCLCEERVAALGDSVPDVAAMDRASRALGRRRRTGALDP